MSSWNFRRCRHLAMISDRLFRRFLPGKLAISNFSARHRLQRLLLGVYGLALRMILQDILGWPLRSFMRHISADKAVLLRYLSRLKVDLWLVYRFLNVLSQSPM